MGFINDEIKFQGFFAAVHMWALVLAIICHGSAAQHHIEKLLREMRQ